MNTRTIKLLSLTLILMLVAGMALAQSQGKGMKARRGGQDGPGKGMRLEMMTKRLDLTDEQKESITALHEKGREEGLEIRKALMRLRHELEGELMKDDPSEKTLLSLNEKIGDLKTEMQANRLKTRLAVREELTPEQRDKMLVMGQKAKHGKQGKKGRRGDGPGGKSQRFGCRSHGNQNCQLDED
jgi:Spy/CpxP family protein refolding chaperone